MRTDGSAPARPLLAAGLLCSISCNGGASGEVTANGSPPPAGPPADSPSTTPAPSPPSDPSAAPPGGQSPIPVDAVYGVHIQGRAGVLSGYAPFAVPAEVHLQSHVMLASGGASKDLTVNAVRENGVWRVDVVQ